VAAVASGTAPIAAEAAGAATHEAQSTVANVAARAAPARRRRRTPTLDAPSAQILAIKSLFIKTLPSDDPVLHRLPWVHRAREAGLSDRFDLLVEDCR